MGTHEDVVIARIAARAADAIDTRAKVIVDEAMEIFKREIRGMLQDHMTCFHFDNFTEHRMRRVALDELDNYSGKIDAKLDKMREELMADFNAMLEGPPPGTKTEQHPTPEEKLHFDNHLFYQHTCSKCNHRDVYKHID